ncbi:MAG TPA: FG-GAP-like repeat-containing protein [Anaerolineales bacterium]|nr:FG-GAP-like repeat-containing protein [Anaerolineales bacterium]
MHRILVLVITAILAIILLFGLGYFRYAAQQPNAEIPIFTDVSKQSGIVNNRLAGIEMSAGIAWGDYDNDGWLDLYVTDPIGKNTLYHNNGDGTFSVSTLTHQVALPNAYSQGATFADYDNDGWKDLLVVTWGPDHLFHNEQGRGFVDVSQQAGIVDDRNSKSASWGDYDGDGFLDLYIANWSCYPKCGRPMEGEADRLYHNNGDGTFTEVTDLLAGGVTGAGFIASFTDYDNDGDLDIYLVNDEFINPLGNKLWRNDGPGCKGWCFTQVAKEANANAKVFGMGLATGDYDNDGDMDYYYSNVGPMELLQNQGDGTFKEVAKQAGVQVPNGIGWGAVFFDYDNDGWQDLYLAISDTTHHKDISANKLFRNNGDGTFTSIACHNESTDVRMSISVAYADYDHDGWVDLIVGNLDEGYRLYKNQTGQTSNHHWLSIELVGAGNVNRDAVGSRVYVTTAHGKTQMQEVINGSSVMAGNSLILHFGLGEERSAEVRIRWSDGTEQVIKNLRADHRYRIPYQSTPQTLPAKQVEKISIRPSLGEYFQFLQLQFLHLRSQLSNDPDTRLAYLMKRAHVYPPTPLPKPSPALVQLGEALFWDPILSGNRDISCATCHHPNLGTGDNLPVSIGTKGFGLGEERQMGNARELIPRNAQPLFNLGYEEWHTLFWDGRVARGPVPGFHTPASDRLPGGLENLLAAQAMFPVTSRDEMRGDRGDTDVFGQPNELAALVDYKAQPIWDALMKRLLAIPAYVELFHAAYPNVPLDELGFQHAANALAAYEIVTFTFEDSPFDRYLQGDKTALSEEAKQGALLFYGKAGCASCHSGGLLSDQKFYNLAVPQIGDGKGREQPLDLGRARETGNDCDRFAFRTPPLRNVTITGPWMHNGAFTSLEAAVRHHFDPKASLQNYDPNQLPERLRDTVQNQPETLSALLQWYTSENASEGVHLSDEEMRLLLIFLDSLTSPSALDLRHTIPASVPSGLPVGGNITTPSSTTNLQP